MNLSIRTICLFFLFSISQQAICQNISDKEVLKTLVSTFLDSVNSEEMHDRFWADDLIYTSSTGKRFGKATIMAGFETESSDDNVGPSPIYTAEDFQIQLHGEMAVVAFKLINTNPEDSTVVEYLNSGTFVKRANKWVVVNWQATKITSEK